MDLLIVTGPLGSGKTTAVNRLLRESLDQGFKVALLVNEFGETSVDGTLLLPFRNELEGIANLVNGCACCSLRSDLVRVLEEWAKLPQGQRPDRVVLETTGLADPTDLVDLEHDAPLRGRLRLAGVLTVLSCLVPTEELLVDPVLRHQITLASTLYLSKGDVDAEAESRWLTRLNEDFPMVPVIRARHGEADQGAPDPWAGDVPVRLRDPMAVTKLTSFGSARSFTLSWDHPIDPQKLEALLKTPPAGGRLLRAKGVCTFAGWPERNDGSDRWVFQYSDWRVDLMPFPSLPDTNPPERTAVIIGRDLDAAAWRAALRSLEVVPKGARRKIGLRGGLHRVPAT
jgi:G3E family GTPase